MTEIEILIAIGTLLVMVIGLIISIIKLWFSIKKNNKSLQTLAEITNINRKQLELQNKQITENISIERERLQFEKYKQQYNEKWKELEALGKISKFLLETDF